jgi:glucose-1-phosphate cytidylyltransferase
MTTPRVSVVVPALNEAPNLPFVLPLIPQWVDEVILVDGRSSDGTAAVAQSLWAGLKVIEQEGVGKGNALRAGFNAASGEIIVMLDADGSTLPSEIPSFVGALVGGADFAKGSRFAQGGGSADISLFRRLGNQGFVLMARLLFGGRYTDLCYGYNAFWKRHLGVLALDADGFEIETMMNLRALHRGLKVVEIPSFEARRHFGSSRLRPVPDGFRVLRTVLLERLRRRAKQPEPAPVMVGEVVTLALAAATEVGTNGKALEVGTNGKALEVGTSGNGIAGNGHAGHSNGERLATLPYQAGAVLASYPPSTGSGNGHGPGSPQASVVILCGGRGSRLRPLTDVVPKPLVEVAGRPILWHIMNHYSASGFKSFDLCLGYNGNLIKDYFLNFYLRHTDFSMRLNEWPPQVLTRPRHAPDWEVTCVDTGDPSVQTGARLRRIEPYLKSPYFLCTYGDAVSDVDLEALVAFHQSHGRIATVTGVHAPAGASTSRFGSLRIEDDTRVVQFAEKVKTATATDSGYINAGFFVFNRGLFDYLAGGDDCVLESGPLQRLAADDQLRVFKHEGFWQCMDTAKERDRLDDILKSRAWNDLTRNSQPVEGTALA